MSNESGTDGSALPSRLSRREKLEARQRLTEWMHPDEMKAIFDTYWQRLDDHFFVQSGLEFLRDAYGAAVFGRLRGATKVRLMPAACQKPDFDLLIGNEVELFDFNEAYKPGRRRTEEAKVRLGQAENTTSTHEEPKLDLLETSFALAECVIEKSQIKDYPKDTALLIYLNRNHYIGDPTETEKEELISLIEYVKHDFKEIWTLACRGAYRIHPAPVLQITDLERNPTLDPSFRPTPISDMFDRLWPLSDGLDRL